MAQSPSVPFEPVTVKKPKSNKRLFLLVVILIVVIVGFIILMIINNNSNNQLLITKTPVPTQTQTPIMTIAQQDNLEPAVTLTSNLMEYKQTVGNKQILLSPGNDGSGYPYALDFTIGQNKQTIGNNQCYFAIMSFDGSLLATQCDETGDFPVTIWEYNESTNSFIRIKDLSTPKDSLLLPSIVTWKGSRFVASIISDGSDVNHILTGSGILTYNANDNLDSYFETCYGEYGASHSVGAVPVMSDDGQYILVQCDGNQKLAIYSLDGESKGEFQTSLPIVDTDAQSNDPYWSQLLAYKWQGNSDVLYKYSSAPESTYQMIKTGL
jgi:hypothetical protein